VCFAKHTLSKHTLGRLGLKPRPSLLLFSSFFWGLSPAQPAWAGLDSTSPARSLAQASDPAGQQARVVQTMRALHRAKVITFALFSYFAARDAETKGKWRPYLAMTKTKAEMKMAEMVFSGERSSFPCFCVFFVMGSLFLWFFVPLFSALFFFRSLPCLFSVSPLLSLFLVSRALYL